MVICTFSSHSFAVGLVNDPKYKNHFVTCFGYEDNSDGKYMRIANGWDRSKQNWYKYNTTYIDGYSYARWN